LTCSQSLPSADYALAGDMAVMKGGGTQIIQLWRRHSLGSGD